MAHRRMLEAVDLTLHHLMQEHLPFGGKVILLGVDFHQVLPVVKRGSQVQVTDACIKRSNTWQHFHIYEPRKNM